MRLNPFAKGGRRGQSPAEVRAERDQMAAEKADLAARLKAADELIGNLVQERDWFHDRWIEVGQRAREAETVVGCLEGQLTVANRKVIELEAIAGPHVDATQEPSPIFNEVTQEIGIPDKETTLSIPVMSLVALSAK